MDYNDSDDLPKSSVSEEVIDSIALVSLTLAGSYLGGKYGWALTQNYFSDNELSKTLSTGLGGIATLYSCCFLGAAIGLGVSVGINRLSRESLESILRD